MDEAGCPDSELIEEFLSGNAASFDALVRRYRDPLFGFLARMVGEDALANDLFQDTFMRVLERFDEYGEAGKFRSWVFQIARNLALDALRRRTFERGLFHRPPDRDDEDSSSPIEYGSSDPLLQPDALAHDAELRSRLESAIGELPDEQREVVILKLEADLTFREIAEITGESINTITGRMRYATDKLRKKLRDFVQEAAA